MPLPRLLAASWARRLPGDASVIRFRREPTPLLTDRSDLLCSYFVLCDDGNRHGLGRSHRTKQRSPQGHRRGSLRHAGAGGRRHGGTGSASPPPRRALRAEIRRIGRQAQGLKGSPLEREPTIPRMLEFDPPIVMGLPRDGGRACRPSGRACAFGGSVDPRVYRSPPRSSAFAASERNPHLT